MTVTDFIWGLRDGAKSLNAGMDLEEPFRQQRAQHLRGSSTAGETTWAMVERAGRPPHRAQLRSYAARAGTTRAPSVVANDEARALAREVAAASMVLLKNDPVDGAPVLPLDRGAVRSIALIGRLATAPNMGDHGSSDVRPPSHVTPSTASGPRFPARSARSSRPTTRRRPPPRPPAPTSPSSSWATTSGTKASTWAPTRRRSRSCRRSSLPFRRAAARACASADGGEIADSGTAATAPR